MTPFVLLVAAVFFAILVDWQADLRGGIVGAVFVSVALVFALSVGKGLTP